MTADALSGGPRPISVAIDGGGVKNDAADHKTRLDLIPPCFTEGVGRVLTSGAEEKPMPDGTFGYGEDNWMRGIKFRRIIGGIKRHLLAIERGEDFDIGLGGTGMQHAYHAGCGLAFLSHYIDHYASYLKFDDRVFTQELSGRTNAIHISNPDSVSDDGQTAR